MTNKRMPSVTRRRAGFTLVEVMVALAVVSVAISALLKQTMSTVDQTAYLRNKTIAHWVALNQLERVYIENRNTNQLIRRERSGSEEMAGQEWYWKIKPEKVLTKGYQQLKVSVYRDEDDQESALITVVGLIDQFHKPKS